jgi:hypothetical protein
MKIKETIRGIIHTEVQRIITEAAQPKFKVGDKVKVKVGPMMQYVHEVIAVLNNLDGTNTFNVKPILPQGARNRYRLGAAGADAEQLELVK